MLPFLVGPASSFLVISDPAAAKHVLRASDNPKTPIYDKGLVAEVSSTGFWTAFCCHCTACDHEQPQSQSPSCRVFAGSLGPNRQTYSSEVTCV